MSLPKLLTKPTKHPHRARRVRLTLHRLDEKVVPASYTWAYTGAFAGQWETGSNWSPAAPMGHPNTGDSVTFPAGSSDCFMMGPHTVDKLTVDSGWGKTLSSTAALTVNGSPSEIHSGTFACWVILLVDTVTDHVDFNSRLEVDGGKTEVGHGGGAAAATVVRGLSVGTGGEVDLTSNSARLVFADTSTYVNSGLINISGSPSQILHSSSSRPTLENVGTIKVNVGTSSVIITPNLTADVGSLLNIVAGTADFEGLDLISHGGVNIYDGAILQPFGGAWVQVNGTIKAFRVAGTTAGTATIDGNVDLDGGGIDFDDTSDINFNFVKLKITGNLTIDQGWVGCYTAWSQYGTTAVPHTTNLTVNGDLTINPNGATTIYVKIPDFPAGTTFFPMLQTFEVISWGGTLSGDFATKTIDFPGTVHFRFFSFKDSWGGPLLGRGSLAEGPWVC